MCYTNNEKKNDINILFIGDNAVGKSSIILKYYNEIFNEKYNPTIEDLYSFDIFNKMNNKLYRTNIIDISGYNLKENINYHNSLNGCMNVIVIVFSVDSISSLDIALSLFDEYKKKEIKTTIILCCNKIDIMLDINRQLLTNIDKPIVYVSAKTKDNIDLLFQNIVQNCDTINNNNNNSRICCIL